MNSKLAAGLIIASLLSCAHLYAQGPVEVISREDKLKAVFIYNFLQYVQWPETHSTDSYVIEVLGNSPIAVPLREIAEMKTIRGKKMEIVLQDSVEEIGKSLILFISASEQDHLEKIKRKLTYKPVLTIGDTEEFAQHGVAINFVIIEGNLKFEMNLQTLEDAGLQISSQLLKLAILVNKQN